MQKDNKVQYRTYQSPASTGASCALTASKDIRFSEPKVRETKEGLKNREKKKKKNKQRGKENSQMPGTLPPKRHKADMDEYCTTKTEKVKSLYGQISSNICGKLVTPEEVPQN